MIIKTKMTEKDFINVNFVFLYSKIAMKLFTGVISIFFILSILTVAFTKAAYSTVITPIVLLAAMPLMTYYAARKNYRTNKRISETIEYQFDKDSLIIKGESFNSQLTWDKFYKVTQTKNWILIWQNRQVANPIPKRDIWEGQLADLKLILNEHKVKNNL